MIKEKCNTMSLMFSALKTACQKMGWLFDEKTLCIFIQNYFSEKKNYMASQVYWGKFPIQNEKL